MIQSIDKGIIALKLNALISFEGISKAIQENTYKHSFSLDAARRRQRKHRAVLEIDENEGTAEATEILFENIKSHLVLNVGCVI